MTRVMMHKPNTHERVRRATGENTKMIQQITQKLKIGDQRTALFLALGHSPYQVVAGLLLGIGWGN